MPKHILVTQPTRIPVPGGKLIEELIGVVNTGTEAFSLAHMVAPPGWTEPPQAPEFGELTIMVRGEMTVGIDGEDILLAAGQAIWVEAGVTVHYRNLAADECEYYAVCIPAFSPERAHRQL